MKFVRFLLWLLVLPIAGIAVPLWIILVSTPVLVWCIYDGDGIAAEHLPRWAEPHALAALILRAAKGGGP